MTRTITIDAVDLVLRVAAKGKGGSEVPPASNGGPYVERILSVTGNKKGDPWCAANVADTGSIALGMLWPLPMTASCAVLGTFAAHANILETIPQRGDIWLKYHTELGRFAHTGFVLSVSPDREHIEVQAGNTIRPGQAGDTREGWLDWTRTEVIGPKDRFVRWVNLL